MADSKAAAAALVAYAASTSAFTAADYAAVAPAVPEIEIKCR